MKTIFLICLSIFTFSCISRDDDNASTTLVVSTLIDKGNLYGNGDEGIAEQNLVISDATQWNELMAKMNSVNNATENFSEVNIDFNEFDVIAVFDELKMYGGYQIDLEITAEAGYTKVKTIESAPTGSAATIITQPYHIVKIQKSDLPVVFE